MIFTPKNKEKVKLDINIGINCIKGSEENRFLGVTIDNKLNFTPHFNKVYDKVKKRFKWIDYSKKPTESKSKT